jgi:tetratricopeptide (TPR) repeat protein
MRCRCARAPLICWPRSWIVPDTSSPMMNCSIACGRRWWSRKQRCTCRCRHCARSSVPTPSPVSGRGYQFTLPVTNRASRSKHNLPYQLTSFVGREQEIAQLALLAVARGQYDDAEPLLVDCVGVARALGDPNLLVVNLGHLAIVVHARGNAKKAASHFEEALTVARNIRNGFLASSVLTYKGRAECSDGNLELAEASLAESLTIADDLKDPVVTVWALERFAELAVPKRAPRRAAAIWGAAARLREKIGIPIPLNEDADYTRAVTTTRVALGDDGFDEAWREGSAMTFDDAVRYALGGQTGRDARAR